MRLSAIALFVAGTAMLSARARADEATPADCSQRPSRASDAYWEQIGRCGCDSVEPTPRASIDYEKWAAACDEWRRAHPSATPAPSPRPSPAASPRSERVRRRSADCAGAPSRASDSYWDYVKRCGCDGMDPVPRASADYGRWAAACDEWRRNNSSHP